jgi:hypothetical protein
MTEKEKHHVTLCLLLGEKGITEETRKKVQYA